MRPDAFGCVLLHFYVIPISLIAPEARREARRGDVHGRAQRENHGAKLGAEHSMTEHTKKMLTRSSTLCSPCKTYREKYVREARR